MTRCQRDAPDFAGTPPNERIACGSRAMSVSIAVVIILLIRVSTQPEFIPNSCPVQAHDQPLNRTPYGSSSEHDTGDKQQSRVLSVCHDQPAPVAIPAILAIHDLQEKTEACKLSRRSRLAAGYSDSMTLVRLGVIVVRDSHLVSVNALRVYIVAYGSAPGRMLVEQYYARPPPSAVCVRA